jgi:hypothetical protein
MAVAIVGTATTGSAANGGNFTINMPVGIATGHLAVVYAVGSAEANLGTSSSNWNTIGPIDHPVSTVRSVVFWKIMGGTPDASIAITGVGGGTNSNCGICVALSGVDQTTPIETSASVNNGAGNNPQGPAVVTARTNTAILVFGGSIDGTGDGTVTQPSGYTVRGAVTIADTFDSTAHGASILRATTGTETPPAWTNWTASVWHGTTLVVQPRALSLALDAGSFTVTGTDATFPRARILSLDAGSYAITGTAATLARGLFLSLDAGSYTISGTAATLSKGFSLPLDSGSYLITGTDASFLITRQLALDSGSYLLTGTAASLQATRIFPLDSGSFLITGVDADLIHGLGAGNYSLTLDPGGYLITGTVSDLLRTYVASVDAGSFVISGTAASFLKTYNLLSESGEYLITGTDADLVATLTVSTVLNNVSPPVVSGTPRKGNLLSCSTGTWTGYGSITYRRQWRRNGENILDETGETYRVRPADAKRTISCILTAQDGLFLIKSQISNTVTILGSRVELSPGKRF